MTAPGSGTPRWHLYVPKLYTVLRQGYSLEGFRDDAIAGLTVAIVALPLAMALAIASGTTPERGLYTAIIAGFLISALGGSRFQIGGPTGAFVVVVFNVIAQYGYDGLVIATLMAGVILVVAGLAGLGTILKYIPHPVVTGFTSGIAVIIFSSQVKDLLGLEMDSVPAEFIDKWHAFLAHLDTIDPVTCAIAALTLAGILLVRRYRPSLPAFLIGVVAGSLAVLAFGLPVDTIGSRFGGIPNALPAPALPDISLERLGELLPSACTIAFLAGVESLLSAVVADGMTGRRHRSNCELVAQGVANCASAVFGGIPATGAIARTATNIRSGARSPVAGMMHAVFLLLFMVALAPLASYIPLASLAAVLVIVAWNMSEAERFRHLMSAPAGDRAAVLITFALTVLVDLTVAIQVGIVFAAILFVHRMMSAVEVSQGVHVIEADKDDFARAPDDRYQPYRDRPAGVEIYEISGPFFFGVATRLEDVLDQLRLPPKVFILRMRAVPMIDASGVHALEEFAAKCRKRGTIVILSGVQPQPLDILKKMGLGNGDGVLFAADLQGALDRARAVLGKDGAAAPSGEASRG
jgi:SulP family sulfate permease